MTRITSSRTSSTTSTTSSRTSCHTSSVNSMTSSLTSSRTSSTTQPQHHDLDDLLPYPHDLHGMTRITSSDTPTISFSNSSTTSTNSLLPAMVQPSAKVLEIAAVWPLEKGNNKQCR